MNIDIKIAVLPLVKEFLQNSYCVEPFKLTHDNPYGIFLYNCLTHVKKVTIITNDLDINTNYYSATLTVRLSERTWMRKGSFIHPDRQKGFNRMVTYHINEIFLLYVDDKLDRGFTQNKAFLDFREKFNICEENMTLKMMEKKYERYMFSLSA